MKSVFVVTFISNFKDGDRMIRTNLFSTLETARAYLDRQYTQHIDAGCKPITLTTASEDVKYNYFGVVDEAEDVLYSGSIEEKPVYDTLEETLK